MRHTWSLKVPRVARISAVLLLGAGCQSATDPPPLASCASPAPLHGTPDVRAPGYLVVFHATVAARPEVARLSAKYGFAPAYIYEYVLQGFAGTLSPAVVASLRCEASVQFVEHNQQVTIGDVAP